MLIDELLKNVNTLAITGHIRPDGDCVGSNLGLYNYVVKNFPEIQVDLFLEEPQGKLTFIKNIDKINSSYDVDREYDLMICLDAASLDRIGQAVKYFEKAKHTVNIDHHISNTKYADENYVNANSSSASETVYGYMDRSKIDRDIAIALYTGIIFDTGVFKYPLTSPDTMRVAADLMEFGIPTNEIIDDSFYAKSYNENRIIGDAVVNSVLMYDGRAIYSYVSQEKMKEFGVTQKDLDGIVPQLRLTRGVLCAFFMYELGPGEYKCSLRSTGNFDVNKIAVKYGGGGHVRASGFNISGEVQDCIDRVMADIKEQLDTYED
ncbi:MAG: bifunctional oligoribonuclease/PAP phosphatase NrnA [Lachnospiraceae bacterium]|nr:bifunctional oligoribonuclease/PAP phosphatase NrnA [Lachnospiraceae bacterium]